MSSLTAWIRVRIRRRSVSSLVSPGPRVPMPPPRRDSAAPAPTSRGSRVLELRELDLELAFAGSRAPGEDVEDELRAIDDLAADLRFDLPQLRRRQLVVEDDEIGARFGARGGERLDLARAEKRRGVGLRPLLQDAEHDLGAGGLRQPGELVERSLGLEPPFRSGDQANERRTLTFGYARPSHACTSSHGIAPGRTSRISRPLTSTMVDGGPPRVCARVEQQPDAFTHRPRDLVRIGRRRRAARIGAGRRERPSAHAAQLARDRMRGHPDADMVEASGHVGRKRGRSSHEQRQRARPVAAARRRPAGGNGANSPFDLFDVGGNQRQRALGGSALDREDPLHSGGGKRIGGKAVQRVGGHGDDPSGPDERRGFFQHGRVRLVRVDGDPAHAVNVRVRSAP